MPGMVNADSTASSTTTISVMQELMVENMTLMEASVITVGPSLTTLELDCKSQYSSNCSSSGMVWPQTVIVGESVQAMNYDVTSYYGGTLWIVSGNASCTVTNISMGALCDLSTLSWYSSGTVSNSSSVDGQQVTLAATLTYATVDVVSGLDKLAVATTSSGASPASMVTTTSAPNTGTLAPSNTADSSSSLSSSLSSSSSSSSSSKAWIAGPVVGAVAGIALVAGLIFWCIRRKCQGDDTVPGAESGTPPELQGNYEAPELQGNYRPSELSGNYEPPELPPDHSARVELAAAQLDFDKKREMEQRAVSELP
ncbi:uncharacterized protein N7483_002077 [Penicillium malachiteum]|uniref:uncharacterized protein n=1 Tax=Penicillium malachiteum TaxID=1324776 RepID=UPI002546964D|nr:uncharacterized protein N7483_002077 [Penicillium malachiteum]KAJ5736952.1 hypothetical protein N7483_002077 [Penicillium malachiteum]